MLSIVLSEDTHLKTLEKEFETDMLTAHEHFERELAKIRTGRAHPAMVEDIKVECYGTLMPIKELATITAPEAQLLVIHPWDKSVINDIEKALALSDLSAAPSNDGTIIRLAIQPMSSSRREELIKTLNKKLEESRITARNIRKDLNALIKQTEKNKKISEDTSKRMQDLLQKVTDKIIANLELMSGKKEKEIMQL